MKNKLSDEQVARKRKDKHAKHEAEDRLMRKMMKYNQDKDITVPDMDQDEYSGVD